MKNRSRKKGKTPIACIVILLIVGFFTLPIAIGIVFMGLGVYLAIRNNKIVSPKNPITINTAKVMTPVPYKDSAIDIINENEANGEQINILEKYAPNKPKADVFCAICKAKKEDIDQNENINICPQCGKETLFVGDPSRWIYIENNGLECVQKFFFIFKDNSEHIWVEIYVGIQEFHKILKELVLQTDVIADKKENDTETFTYVRNRNQFELTFVDYVSDLIDPWWDGEPFIEFKFVDGDDLRLEAYKEELSTICSILNKNDRLL